ncbi:30760_t:CDS:2, partial [Gigaspora margarita]
MHCYEFDSLNIEKISQAQEICYIDASMSFDPLNTSSTLLYTSCAAGTLPFGLFLTSDEQEFIIEKAVQTAWWTFVLHIDFVK